MELALLWIIYFLMLVIIMILLIQNDNIRYIKKEIKILSDKLKQNEND